MYNFHLVNADTDSITICKPDHSPFTEEERTRFLEELNSQFPERINWADDGYFLRFVVVKAKNYVMFDGKKIKMKGSGLKDGKKEAGLRDFISEIFKAIVEDKPHSELTEIYHKYVHEILNVKDIKRWSSRKTLSSKTFSSTRANESKIIDALGEDSEYVEGDRVWMFFMPDNTLELAENYKGFYNQLSLLKKLHSTSKLFDLILPTKELFINYSLVRNQEAVKKFI